MHKKRRLFIFTVLVLILSLLAVSLATAQSGRGADSSPPIIDRETELEHQRARQAEAEAARSNHSPVRSFGPMRLNGDQLFAGVDSFTIPSYLIDVLTGSPAPAFTGEEVWSATYNPDDNRVLFTGGVDLWQWPLDGGAPTLIGNVTSAATGNALSIVGLAYHDGTLYGSRTLGGDDPEGIYIIDQDTAVATIFITIANPSAADIGGLAVDPATGTFYGTSDSSQNSLVQIALDGTVSIVAPYPAGENDVDGLGIGDGKAYMVIDEPGDIYVYDLVAGAYTTPLPSPWTVSEIFSGGAYVPGAGQELIFADDFESGDLSAWTLAQTDGGDLAATAAAALEGNFGMEALIDDANRLFVADDSPAAETHYTASFQFDPNSLAMGNGDTFIIFVAGDLTAAQLASSRPPLPIFAIEFGMAGGNYGARALVRDDNGAVGATAPGLLADGPNTIAVDWQAASAPGADDGSLSLTINDVEVGSVTGLDNDAQRIELAALGVPLGPSAGASGSLYFDAFASFR